MSLGHSCLNGSCAVEERIGHRRFCSMLENLNSKGVRLRLRWGLLSRGSRDAIFLLVSRNLECSAFA